MSAEIQDRKYSPEDNFLNGFSGNILNILIIKIGSGWVWEILAFCVVEEAGEIFFTIWVVRIVIINSI